MRDDTSIRISRTTKDKFNKYKDEDKKNANDFLLKLIKCYEAHKDD